MRAGSTISTGIPNSSRKASLGSLGRGNAAGSARNRLLFLCAFSRLGLVFSASVRDRERCGHAARQTRRHSPHRRSAGLATFPLARTCSHRRFRRSASLQLDLSRRFNAAQWYRSRCRRDRSHPCRQEGWQGRRRARQRRAVAARDTAVARDAGGKGMGAGIGARTRQEPQSRASLLLWAPSVRPRPLLRRIWLGLL